MTASAQTTPSLRTPRRLFNGKIDIRNANINDPLDNAASNPNTAQGREGQREAVDRGVTCSRLRPLLERR
jgi:hypothetical protein